MSLGGSSKDRVALAIVNDAESKGLIHPHTNSTIFEGTVGSTGISLALVCRAKGYKCHILMPDDQSQAKYGLHRYSNSMKISLVRLELLWKRSDRVPS